MSTYIENNAQAHSFRAKHEKAYFMQVGASTMLHQLAIVVSTVSLVLAMIAAATLWGGIPTVVGLLVIFILCAILFVVAAFTMLAASKQAHRLLSALTQSDFADVEAAGIFRVQTKVVK
jgi:hypothetical protein